MEIQTPEKKQIHQGRNMKRWRQIMGVPQIDIAEILGVTQQTVSNLEDKEELDDLTLEKVSGLINVPVEILKNKEPQTAIDSIINTFTVSDSGQANGGNIKDVQYAHYYNCTFHPIEKITELYERLLAMEREKNK